MDRQGAVELEPGSSAVPDNPLLLGGEQEEGLDLECRYFARKGVAGRDS